MPSWCNTVAVLRAMRSEGGGGQSLLVHEIRHGFASYVKSIRAKLLRATNALNVRRNLHQPTAMPGTSTPTGRLKCTADLDNPYFSSVTHTRRLLRQLWRNGSDLSSNLIHIVGGF